MHGKKTSRHVGAAQKTAYHAGQSEKEVCLVQGGQYHKVPWVKLYGAAAVQAATARVFSFRASDACRGSAATMHATAPCSLQPVQSCPNAPHRAQQSCGSLCCQQLTPSGRR